MTASIFLLVAALPAAPVNDVKLPHGFTARLYSDQALANDIYTMTIDDTGRVFVAGRGYVKELVDDNADGTADRAVTLLNNLKDGPMGLLAEGDSLYVVSDGGLKRYGGLNARTLGKPELIYAVKTSGEHEAHAVHRGPDGWLYLMCGNMSGVKKEHLDPLRSPVKDPVAGTLLRISPDGKTIEAVVDGFRNAYGFDFNLDGEPFTFDSDNERCVGLPWYEPCRFYHIVPGGNYGWRSPQLSQTWRKPPYFADVVPPVGTTGRGSPTGVACYRNTLFPPAYRGGFFIADWTFGKIWFVPLAKQHSTYAGKPEVFLEAVGESGFAPTALAVHPKTGELYISIGGRGTRGAVYRISHERGGPAAEIPMAKRGLEWNEADLKEWLADAVGPDALKRRQALDAMLRFREKLGYGDWLGDAVRPNLSHPDPLIRAAAARMVVQAFAPVGPQDDPIARLTLALHSADEYPDHALKVALDALEAPYATLPVKLLAVRVAQRALGDLGAPGTTGTVGEGYTFRKPIAASTAQRVLKVILAVTAEDRDRKRPKSTPELDRELARLVGGVGVAAGHNSNEAVHITFWLAERLHLNKDSKVEDDLHYLAAMSRMIPYSLRDVDGTLTYLMSRMDKKVAEQSTPRDRNWFLRWDEIAAGLITRHPFMAHASSWRIDSSLSRPEHLAIIRRLGEPEGIRARLAAPIIEKHPDYPWTAGAVEMLLPLHESETRPILLKLREHGGLDDAILPILAKTPQAEDGPMFVGGLRSLNPETVRVSAAAMMKLQPQKDQADVIAAILALRKLPDDKPAAGPRDALLALLKDRTGQNHADAKAWSAWFTQAKPELAAKLNATDGFDAAAWKKREPNIPWAGGDAAKGRAVFAKATCASCHDGGGAVGPSLAGVSKRFSREDLLTAILQPSKDVSPRYRPVRVATKDGKVHIGMIVYEAVSGVILQTGPDAVVRIDGDRIESQKTLETSLMPAGLLEKVTDAEIADLMAYLRSG